MNHANQKVIMDDRLNTFNSLYLGFFHESHWYAEGVSFWTHLSIPSTWDFSMNRLLRVSLSLNLLRSLSIPSTWDFSMNLRRYASLWCWLGILSIPSTWDFSMNLNGVSAAGCSLLPFNSLYLGFFHESQRPPAASSSGGLFQFPLLGIFPWITTTLQFCYTHGPRSFNSLYLGFFHESDPVLA